jgi:hypothetical protein
MARWVAARDGRDDCGVRLALLRGAGVGYAMAWAAGAACAGDLSLALVAQRRSPSHSGRLDLNRIKLNDEFGSDRRVQPGDMVRFLVRPFSERCSTAIGLQRYDGLGRSRAARGQKRACHANTRESRMTNFFWLYRDIAIDVRIDCRGH